MDKGLVREPLCRPRQDGQSLRGLPFATVTLGFGKSAVRRLRSECLDQQASKSHNLKPRAPTHAGACCSSR